MNKFNYFKINKSKNQVFKHDQENTTMLFFYTGLCLIRGKPHAFLNFAKKNKLGFLALEYSGHGKSSGKFIDGNISRWTNETTILIKKIVKKNKFIGWFKYVHGFLNQFKFFKNRF